jgi:hypothetical protein
MTPAHDEVMRAPPVDSRYRTVALLAAVLASRTGRRYPTSLMDWVALRLIDMRAPPVSTTQRQTSGDVTHEQYIPQLNIMI